MGQIQGLQQRGRSETAKVPRHGRRPQQPFEHYVDRRLFYDCAGWAAPVPAAELGADWVRYGMQEVAFSQVVFATDYPQAVRHDGEVAAYVDAVRELGPNCRAMLEGANAEKLIPDVRERLARRVKPIKSQAS